jgi:hypothetical protein
VASAATGSSQARSTAPEIRVTPEQQHPSTTLDGERKTVTALFADIKGSTELMRDFDPEEARAIVDPAMASLPYSARRSRTRTIRNARYTRRSRCSSNSATTLSSWPHRQITG